ncbi:MAG: hypothetical protein FJ011_16660 [Chloroflexi bacterium]|nr:hypothetical protein [Chloroflexota bacterium]
MRTWLFGRYLWIRSRCLPSAREEGVTVVEYIALAAVVLIMLSAAVWAVENSTGLIGNAIAGSFDAQIRAWR